MQTSSVRCGIDTGGTFTDFVGGGRSLGGTRRLEVAVVARAIRSKRSSDVVRESNLPPESIYFLILGTTVATNALIQRRGASRRLYHDGGVRGCPLHPADESASYHYSYEWTKPLPFVEMRATAVGVQGEDQRQGPGQSSRCRTGSDGGDGTRGGGNGSTGTAIEDSALAVCAAVLLPEP